MECVPVGVDGGKYRYMESSLERSERALSVGGEAEEDGRIADRRWDPTRGTRTADRDVSVEGFELFSAKAR
ncbi:unnamed protein product [Nezara viridula]|uniref:Uncharacterized protein n=1 Tax=Nezara viridula TaxID=85310 RepID=A0A9P0E585_NEZVI|nr:unnamed protein product [Nezara viridula]